MPLIDGRKRFYSRESVQSKITAPFAGFLSVAFFGRHERKFKRHFKGLFSQAYRQFESLWSASKSLILQR
jgi:hypothetical protein